MIDVTYNYLINGAGTTNGPFDQVRALTGDGVEFSKVEGNNSESVSLADRLESALNKAVPCMPSASVRLAPG